jgi:hypothetical protein
MNKMKVEGRMRNAEGSKTRNPRIGTKRKGDAIEPLKAGALRDVEEITGWPGGLVALVTRFVDLYRVTKSRITFNIQNLC